LRYKQQVQVRLLLGPAGSGKTHRCLTAIRAALHAAPEGPPLVFLAPKQSTFQLERLLLSEQSLSGYARLRFVSFERLAEWALTALGHAPRRLLREEGRVMVLRALLRQGRDALRQFHAAARLPGFALATSRALRELQQHHVTPTRLRALALDLSSHPQLADKLLDLAFLLEAYLQWLAGHRLEDADRLLELAAAVVREAGAVPAPASTSTLHFAGLWLDGFAEMTPSELDLLSALLPWGEQATLAFCLDTAETGQVPWFSPWSTVSRTLLALRRRLDLQPGLTVTVEVLPRSETESRFARSPSLRYLEAHWDRPVPGGTAKPPDLADGSIRLVACRDAETEARVAAREIVCHVRDRGGRFRDTAVLVRSLDTRAETLRRVFTAYGIPCFMDRREPVAHHPLAELTRGALRTVAWVWRSEDWFATLKTGLVPLAEEELDSLENEALARGWEGEVWLQPWSAPDYAGTPAWAEELRRKVVGPFAKFAHTLNQAGNAIPGAALAAALRALWLELGVPRRLTAWSAEHGSPETQGTAPPAQIHLTVWEQMQAWLEDVELAFATETLSLREWLPILEAGLAGLTVGAIPPGLDQVLVGAVDRARNPDPALVLVLGLNESVFPSAPLRHPLLTDPERGLLTRHGVELLADERSLLARERYYAYVACTRARHRLVLTYAERDHQDRPMNPSPFLAHVRRLFPALAVETPPPPTAWTACVHPNELLPHLIRATAQRLPSPTGECGHERLAPAIAERLHGPRTLKCSVSRLEQFAACPFQFFVTAGLRAEERRRFELDARQSGSFQHAVLARFHADLSRHGQRWRDLTPETARERLGQIADQVSQEFGHGLFRLDDENRLTAHSLKLALQDFIEVAVTWLHAGYDFDPVAVELQFGGADAPLPAWDLPLDDRHVLSLHGKMDRVDLCRDPDTGVCWCVVVDYKSTAWRLDDVRLANGLQLQLPVYLAALARLASASAVAAGTTWQPAGMFYVPLRPNRGSAPDRAQALAEAEAARQEAYRHRGRFRADVLPRLDRAQDRESPSGQFSSTQRGRAPRKYADAMPAPDFAALLARTENQLCELGRRIFAGEAAIAPAATGRTEIACDRCDYASICRLGSHLDI
jgi:ATP-dependent helicase/nuclease subunit B